jgi:hypothetical protein
VAFLPLDVTRFKGIEEFVRELRPQLGGRLVNCGGFGLFPLP